MKKPDLYPCKLVLQFETCSENLSKKVLKNEEQVSYLMTPKTQKVRTEIIAI